MDETGSGSCLVADYDVGSFDSSAYAARELARTNSIKILVIQFDQGISCRGMRNCSRIF